MYTWVEGSVPGDQRSRRLAVEGGLLQRQVDALQQENARAVKAIRNLGTFAMG